MSSSSTDVSFVHSPPFWERYLACLSVIPFQGYLILLYAAIPLIGLCYLWFVTVQYHSFKLWDAGIVLFSFFYMPLMHAFACWNAGRTQFAKYPYSYRFDAEGIHTSNQAFKSLIKWDAILRVRQTNRFLSLFYSSTKALYISKTVLRRQHALETLNELIVRHIKSN